MSEDIENDKNLIISKVYEVSEFARGLSANTEEMAATSQEVSIATAKIAEVAQVLEAISKKLMEKYAGLSYDVLHCMKNASYYC